MIKHSNQDCVRCVQTPHKRHINYTSTKFIYTYLDSYSGQTSNYRLKCSKERRHQRLRLDLGITEPEVLFLSHMSRYSIYL